MAAAGGFDAQGLERINPYRPNSTEMLPLVTEVKYVRELLAERQLA